MQEACQGGALKRGARVTVIGAVGAIFLSLLPLRSYTAFWHPPRHTEAGDLRAAYGPAIKLVRRVTPPNARVFLIIQNTTGFAYVVLSYEIAPRLNNHGHFSWSIRAPEKVAAVYQTDVTPGEWASDLARSFDYVWVIEADPAFVHTYGPLFEGGRAAPGLFGVLKENGAVRLKSIAPWSSQQSTAAPGCTRSWNPRKKR